MAFVKMSVFGRFFAVLVAQRVLCKPCFCANNSGDPYSTSYIGTLVKVVYALSKAFVLPGLGGPRSVASGNYLGGISSIQKTALQKLKIATTKLSGRGMVVRPAAGDDGPQARTFVTKKGDLLMEDLRSRLKSFKLKLAKLETRLAQRGRSQNLATQKLRLQIAQHKQARAVGFKVNVLQPFESSYFVFQYGLDAGPFGVHALAVADRTHQGNQDGSGEQGLHRKDSKLKRHRLKNKVLSKLPRLN